MYTASEQRLLTTLTKSLLTATVPLFEADIVVQLNDLQKVIRYHEWRYYISNEPVISDFEYDTLFKKLQALEQQFPNLVTSDSPTQRVSPDLTEGFAAVPHLTPMLSLENSYNAEDLNDFDEQIKKLCALEAEEEIEYFTQMFYDLLSLFTKPFHNMRRSTGVIKHGNLFLHIALYGCYLY